MACEYLLINGAKIDIVDDDGFTALHLATETGNTALAYLLLKHRAKYDIKTNDGRKPIDIAVNLTNADIVTLLRLTQLNDEIGIGENEEIGGDATYNDVMRDFSHLTLNQPQRLQNQRHRRAHSSSSSVATGGSNNTQEEAESVSME